MVLDGVVVGIQRNGGTSLFGHHLAVVIGVDPLGHQHLALGLSLGLGEGGEMLAPMAISIIGGLIASTLVTLFLIPILYDIINDRKNKKKLKQEEKAAHTAELEAMWAKEDALVE